MGLRAIALLCRLLNPEISAADGGGKGGITLNELSNKIRYFLAYTVELIIQPCRYL